MFIALKLLILVCVVLLWVALTSKFGTNTYNNAKKIYKNLTEDEEETKGEKEEL